MPWSTVRLRLLRLRIAKCCDPLSKSLSRTSDWLFLLPRTVDPRIAACHQSSTRVEIVFGISRHHPAPDLISSVKVSDLRDVLAALRFGPSIAFTYLQSI
jgi:hypothetical protein